MPLSSALQQELQQTAQALVAPGKGILAADEPVEYMGRVLSQVNLANIEDNRRRYRQVLFTADEGISKHLAGVILLPETVHQRSDKGVLFVELLRQKQVIAGVNVDGGLVLLYGTDGEVITQGLDDLDKRCAEYKQAGCRFAKWRAALRISKTTPSPLAVQANAAALARYASVCQANGLVPIVEPEVQLEGDHDLATAQRVAESVLTTVYKALQDYHVHLEGTLLKPSMVLPGNRGPRCTPEEIGLATVAAFKRSVPAAVPGIGFLSGGQGQDEATRNLLAINKCAGKNVPWALTFIFGRALQASVPAIWAGKEENARKAQGELLRRLEYQEDGFYVIENFLTDAECDLLKKEGMKLVKSMPDKAQRVVHTTTDYRQGQSRYYMESADKMSYFFEDGAIGPDGELLIEEDLALGKIAHGLHLHNNVFKKFTFDNRVKEVCRKLKMVKPAVCQSMIMYKNPKIGGVVTPHQDATYLYTTPVNLVGFWYALEDATLENGCLWFLKDSHKHGVYRRYIRNPDKGSNDLVLFDSPGKQFDLDDFTPCPVKKGSCVLIHGQVVHYSKPNTSLKSRHAYTYHVIEEHNTEWSKENWLQIPTAFLRVYDN